MARSVLVPGRQPLAGGRQGGGERVADAPDLDRTKIHRQYIECGFRRPLQRADQVLSQYPQRLVGAVDIGVGRTYSNSEYTWQPGPVIKISR